MFTSTQTFRTTLESRRFNYEVRNLGAKAPYRDQAGQSEMTLDGQLEPKIAAGVLHQSSLPSGIEDLAVLYSKEVEAAEATQLQREGDTAELTLGKLGTWTAIRREGGQVDYLAQGDRLGETQVSKNGDTILLDVQPQGVTNSPGPDPISSHRESYQHTNYPNQRILGRMNPRTGTLAVVQEEISYTENQVTPE